MSYLSYFRKSKVMVDICLNADEGILNICIVPKLNDEIDIKYWSLPTMATNTDNGSRIGWVPHFITSHSSVNASICVAKIPLEWYGIINDKIFKDYE